MFSARAAIRALRAPISRSVSRPISTAPQRSALTSIWKSPALVRLPRLAAPFSTTFRFEKSNAEEDLILKLTSELDLEKGINGNIEMPQLLSDFLEDNSFKINEEPGQEGVELIRQFRDETIRVVFSISDLNAVEDEAPFDEEDSPAQRDSGSAQPAAERNYRNIEDDEYAEDDDEPAFPAHVDVTIEKPNQGALHIKAIAQDGMMVIENIFYLKDATLATARTAEADWERAGVYGGPPFGNLDEGLQLYFENYLADRGISTAMAVFIPDYIDYKEEKEYLRWLEDVKNFVSA